MYYIFREKDYKTGDDMVSRKEWERLSLEDKNRELYFQQVETLRLFLERKAISQAQYEKSLHDLTVKMHMENE